MKRWPILVVDDEPVSRESLAAWLREDGWRVETAASGAEAVERARLQDYGVCLIDLRMSPGMDGLDTLRAIRKLRPESALVIVTAYATVDTAVAAIKEGAQDYIVKPCNPEAISLLVDRLVKVRRLERENLALRRRLARRVRLHDLVSRNPRMLQIFDLIREVASLRSTVLIQGESGTGKEMIARAIHASGDRADKPFVAVSCGALTETLLESELFGYEKGAFTGAAGRKRGKLELAADGTILLDEIGDISPKLQMDLLRVLQERRFFRVGGNDEVPFAARVLAATKVDIEEAVHDGRFRDDLFYRLNVIIIRIPPLRERREDIPYLAQLFVETLSAELGKDVSELSSEVMKLLIDHDWPGNVRELQNAIERALVTCKGGVLREGDFAFLAIPGTHAAGWRAPTHLPLREVERQVIEAVLQRTGGNIKEAAEILEVDRSTIYDRIKRHQIHRR
jgi:DNA-binding NtrC family response regulator